MSGIRFVIYIWTDQTSQFMKKVIGIIFIVFISFSKICTGQEADKFTPYFKPVALVFTNFSSSFNKDGNANSFGITRSYLGFEYFFSKKFSSRVVTDIADPGAGSLQMVGIIKNAYFLYQEKKFSARLGMIGLNQFSLQEKQWGYRYVYKSFQDAYNFGSSADLGAAFEYTPAEFISFDFSLLNGEGFKKQQSDSSMKVTAGITLKPGNGFVVRGYSDYMNRTYAQQSYSLYAGWSNAKYRAGIEFNWQYNNSLVNNHDYSGISAYASVILNEKFSVFARYDNLSSATLAGDENPWNYNKNGQMFIAGFDFTPVKGIRIAPTYFGWSPENTSKPFTSTAALNFEIKF